jgi:hypothetical protein
MRWFSTDFMEKADTRLINLALIAYILLELTAIAFIASRI